MPLAHRRTPLLIALAVLSLLAAFLAVPPGRAGAAVCGTANAALGRPATASSTENASFPAGNAVDGNPGTRWSSAFSDPQWVQVDLGASTTVCGVTLSWETAFARSLQIQVAPAATGPFTTVFSTTTGAGGTQTLTVTGTGRFVRMTGTVRATQWGYSLWELAVRTTAPSTPPPDAFWGDTASIPPAQNVLMVKVVNRTNGQFPDSQVFWTFGGQTHSIADQPFVDLSTNSAGRMVFHLGSATSQFTDFIEFTVGPDVFNGNTTRVEGFGLKLALRLRAHDGSDVQVGEDQATFAQTTAATFQQFVNEVPAEFKVLAQDPAHVRIPSPGNHPSFRGGGVNANYFAAYASSVGITAPTSDIFGCAGVLAQDANHCAALNRHVAQLPQAQWNTPSLYYQASPANWYAKFWHDHAINHLAYGFPYDDVAGESSFVSHADPQWLLVAVGF